MHVNKSVLNESSKMMLYTDYNGMSHKTKETVLMNLFTKTNGNGRVIYSSHNAFVNDDFKIY